MAQMVTKGFVADVKVDEIGEKKTKKVTLSFIDDTHRKGVFFPILCWGKIAEKAEHFCKGQRLYLTVIIEDGSYIKTDEAGKEVVDKDGKPVRIFAYIYTCTDYVEDPRIEVDLFSEFLALKSAVSSDQDKSSQEAQAHPELTPVETPLPF